MTCLSCYSPAAVLGHTIILKDSSALCYALWSLARTAVVSPAARVASSLQTQR